MMSVVGFDNLVEETAKINKVFTEDLEDAPYSANSSTISHDTQHRIFPLASLMSV